MLVFDFKTYGKSYQFRQQAGIDIRPKINQFYRQKRDWTVKTQRNTLFAFLLKLYFGWRNPASSCWLVD